MRGGLRLLLLLTLAAGIAMMHTVGHLGPGGHGAHASSDASMAIDVCHADLIGAGATLDPADVCVAILNASGLLTLLAGALLGARGWLVPAGDPRPVLGTAGRGPPVHVRLGLRVADLSVLRR